MKSKDSKALAAWYQKQPGIEFGDQTYFDFKWVNQNNPGIPGHTVFSFFEEDTKYFAPSSSKFMINFRVKNLIGLLKKLKTAGVQIVGDVEIMTMVNSVG